MQNGSASGETPAAVDYADRAVTTARRVWTSEDLRPYSQGGRTWAVVLMGHAVVYALLDIARAIRERS